MNSVFDFTTVVRHIHKNDLIIIIYNQIYCCAITATMTTSPNVSGMMTEVTATSQPTGTYDEDTTATQQTTQAVATEQVVTGSMQPTENVTATGLFFLFTVPHREVSPISGNKVKQNREVFGLP